MCTRAPFELHIPFCQAHTCYGIPGTVRALVNVFTRSARIYIPTWEPERVVNVSKIVTRSTFLYTVALLAPLKYGCLPMEAVK